MWTSNSRRARQVAVWVALAGAALLVTACSSSTSSTASTVASTASTPTAPASPASSTGSPSAAASSPGPAAVSPAATAPQTGTSTFLAEGQDVTGTALFEPACGGYGCALSGDSTAFLYHMSWTTWSATEAVGSGTYKLNACHPSCAAGTVYPVPAVVTLSQPVKVCSSSGARWFWSRASFAFPDGLPKALQGQDAPQNPWTFDIVVASAQQSCA
jgi:hypothetical protein